MKIQPQIYKNISFKGQRESKDYSYQLLTNPEMPKDKMEKAFVKAFNLRYPNWKDDPAKIHRLKQDTVRGRMAGRYHEKLLDFDIPEWVGPVGGVALPIYLTSRLIDNYKGLESLNKLQKIVFGILIPLCIYGGTSSTKYIVTGRRLFEKKPENAKAENAPQVAVQPKNQAPTETKKT